MSWANVNNSHKMLGYKGPPYHTHTHTSLAHMQAFKRGLPSQKGGSSKKLSIFRHPSFFCRGLWAQEEDPRPVQHLSPSQLIDPVTPHRCTAGDRGTPVKKETCLYLTQPAQLIMTLVRSERNKERNKERQEMMTRGQSGRELYGSGSFVVTHKNGFFVGGGRWWSPLVL